MHFWKASRPEDQFTEGIYDKPVQAKTIPADYAGYLSLLKKHMLGMQIVCPVMASPKQPGMVDGETTAGDTARAPTQSLSDPDAH